MPKIHKINKKNHFGDVLTNIFYHGDVLTNFWARFDQFGEVLTRGRFDCNPRKFSACRNHITFHVSVYRLRNKTFCKDEAHARKS